MTLIDPSVWVAYLRGTANAALAATVQTLLLSGEGVRCPIIRLELWAGVGNARDRRRLSALDQTVEELAIDDRVWDSAVELADRARSRGLMTPPADLLIFSCARVHGAELLHRDRHFDLLAKL